mgnify:FL=1
MIEEEGQVIEQPQFAWPQSPLHPFSSLLSELSLLQQHFFSVFLDETSFSQECFELELPQAIAVLGIKNMPSKTINIM